LRHPGYASDQKHDSLYAYTTEGWGPKFGLWHRLRLDLSQIANARASPHT